ncbi:mitochondrial cardiolipin hydrolase [Biomphalaria pfeifferi]|uniref:Mitochondrial cardiolipin hydrolase n=1 Tax=Biomphalaria pfeifferi TaxID=112525 RepID=A0AAD8BMP8_BIOPF|nr:mitochondrial cardiolipin hydrolase [Biomphalaria pfeifferi]
MRIITDKDQLSSPGSKIWNLRKEGIPVRVNDSSFLMHHKFVIVDEKILINGSFNWTYQAITGNKENVIITDDISVTSLFKAEFQRLWDEFYKPLTQEEENQISLRQSRPPLKKQDFS